jgi:hypothetical protein
VVVVVNEVVVEQIQVHHIYTYFDGKLVELLQPVVVMVEEMQVVGWY